MTQAPTAEAIIDACVFFTWRHQQDLYPYLAPGTREYYGRPGLLPGGHGMAQLLPPPLHHAPGGRWLRSAYDDDGPPPASTYEGLRTGLLDRQPIERAVLTFADAGGPGERPQRPALSRAVRGGEPLDKRAVAGRSR